MAELPPTFVSGFHDEVAVSKMKYNVLGGTGLKVSCLSVGTGGFCSQYGDYSIEDCKQMLYKAIKAGINYIDTAPWYGHGVAEEVLGKCLEGIPREAYYLATKVGRYEEDPNHMFNFSSEKTKWSIDNSLRKLGVDYIDIIQAHDIEFAPSLDIVLNETLPTLEEAVKMGKAKFIGVTGYPLKCLESCIIKSTVKIDTVLSYTRLSLLDSALNEYLPIFKSKDLGIINAAVNCMGLLSNTGPQPWHPASKQIKEVCREAQEYCITIGVELAKLALYYSLEQPGPHTHLVGMNKCDLLNSNMDVLYNGLTDLEMEVLRYLQENVFIKLQRTDWEEELDIIKESLLN